MTTVVALHKPGYGTVVGSDTQYSDGRRKGFLQGGKWFMHAGWGVGVCGALRTMNVIEQHLDFLFEDLETPSDFVDRLVDLAHEYEFSFVGDEHAGPPSVISGYILLVNATAVYEIDCTLSVVEIPAGELAAIGSGSEFALGAGFALAGTRDPQARVRSALAASTRYDSGTSGGPVIAALLLKPPKKPAVALEPTIKPGAKARVIFKAQPKLALVTSDDDDDAGETDE